MHEQTYWNGKPAEAKRALVHVPQHDPNDEDHPPEAWWAGIESSMAKHIPNLPEPIDLQGQIVEAVVVWRSDIMTTHLLYDGDGSGWAKVTDGHGGPRWGHRELPLNSVIMEWLD